MYISSFGWERWEWELNEWFIGFNADEHAPVVYADEIWQIIATTWEVTITNNGEERSWSWLVHADKVLLLAWAELVFAMQWWVQAKIIWPAEFELEKEGEAYLINMLSWEFVEIKSVEEQELLTDREFVADAPIPTPAKPAVQVVVKTAEFEVSSDTTLGDIDMTITEKDGKQIVENTWIDVIITKIIKDKTVVTELKSQQKAAINGEVHVAMITPDVEITEKQAEALVENIKNNDLTIAYKIEDQSEKSQEAKKTEEPVVAAQAIPVAGNEVVWDTAKSPEPQPLEELVGQGKRVIWWTELTALQNATHGSVLMRDVRNIVASHAYGYQPWITTSLTNLAGSLRPVTQDVLWGMQLRTDSIAGMEASLQWLISNIEAKWYVPPVYINRLKSTIAWLRLVQTVPAWSAEATCDFECIVTDVLQIQPHQRSRLMLQ